MASSTVLSDPSDASPPPAKESSGTVPSGFILKLYQMVNGAPDDIISWTPAGDAFKIGSDLNKLEAETLPKYFRHSRFQSLVRQLNFYNFRKVNRERTFWIYKHHLFHRERPQDLHLLRRRTCPGVDGRKNRFTTGLPSKSSSDGDKSPMPTLHCLDSADYGRCQTNSREQSSDEDTPSDAEPSDDESVINARKPRRKRNTAPVVMEKGRFPESKRSRRGWNLNYASRNKENQVEESNVESQVTVDMSLVNSSSVQSFAFFENFANRDGHATKEDDDDEQSLSVGKGNRSEMIEQSLVVSEVAMKLEEYVRKAKRGKASTRRTGPQAVVTPPHPNAQCSMMYAAQRGVLTYDDEYEYDSDASTPHSPQRTRISPDTGSTCVVTDGDDSMTSDDEPRNPTGKRLAFESLATTPVRPEIISNTFCSIPVKDEAVVSAVTSNLYRNVHTNVPAAIARFCMTTPPNGTDDLCNKILHLISTCDRLGIEFQQYRGALHPLECSSTFLPPCMFSTGFRKNHAVSVQQIWERSASRNDAVRDFKTFAVNCIHSVLTRNSKVLRNNLNLSQAETSALKYTADIWLKSSAASF